MAICPSKNSLRPDFLSIFDQIARLVAGRVAYFSRLPIAQAYSSYVKITLSSGGKIDQFFVAAPDATAANFEGAKPQCIRPGTRVQKNPGVAQRSAPVGVGHSVLSAAVRPQPPQHALGGRSAAQNRQRRRHRLRGALPRVIIKTFRQFCLDTIGLFVLKADFETLRFVSTRPHGTHQIAVENAAGSASKARLRELGRDSGRTFTCSNQ